MIYCWKTHWNEKAAFSAPKPIWTQIGASHVFRNRCIRSITNLGPFKVSVAAPFLPQFGVKSLNPLLRDNKCYPTTQKIHGIPEGWLYTPWAYPAWKYIKRFRTTQENLPPKMNDSRVCLKTQASNNWEHWTCSIQSSTTIFVQMWEHNEKKIQTDFHSCDKRNVRSMATKNSMLLLVIKRFSW